MNVYVESNFVLEIALEQEQHTCCENILRLCTANKIRLLLPAYSTVEPYEAIIRRRRERKRVSDDFAKEMKNLTRSRPYQIEAEAISKILELLARSNQEEERRLEDTIKRLLRAATIIPLGKSVLTSALKFQQTLYLSPQDSIVYASVIQHLITASEPSNCFLTRNSRDFDSPDIVDALNKHNCKMMFSFEDGYKYIQSALS